MHVKEGCHVVGPVCYYLPPKGTAGRGRSRLIGAPPFPDEERRVDEDPEDLPAEVEAFLDFESLDGSLPFLD